MGYSVLSQRGDDLYEKRYVSELEGCVPIADDSIVTIYDTIGQVAFLESIRKLLFLLLMQSDMIIFVTILLCFFLSMQI